MMNVKRIKVKAISLIVITVMLLGAFPFAAFAAAKDVEGNALVENTTGETGKNGKIENYCLDLKTVKDGENSYIIATPAPTGTNTTDFRFSLKDYSDNVNGVYYGPKDAKKTMLWSMDILVPSSSTTGFKSINLATDGGETMVKSLNLNEIGGADKWHNLSIIYQPGTNGENFLGTASLFVDGKYISSKSLGNLTTVGNNPRGKEYRTIIISDANSPIYIDNILLAEVEGFALPCVTSGINAESYLITGYGGVTVADEKQAMAAALGVGADNISIKSADGAVADGDSLVAPGMKAVIAVNVSTENFSNENAINYSVEYTFGVPYKLLTSIINPTVGSISSLNDYITDLVGVTGSSIENGKIGGKGTNDTYMKFVTANSNDSMSRFAIRSKKDEKLLDNDGKVIILSADMYISADDIDCFEYVRFMRSGGSSNSGQLSVSDFIPNQWNKILYVLYNDENQYYGDLYLNGELKQAGYHDSAKTISGDLRFCVKYNTAGKKFYIDNLSVATSDSFERPEINTEDYVARVITCQDGRIDGYKGKTVSDIKKAAVGLSGTVYNADGSNAVDSENAVQNMYFVAEKDLSDASKYGFFAGKYSYKYVLKTAGYSFGAWSAKLDETDLKDNKYSAAGKLTVECAVDNFLTDPVSGIAIFAEFDPDGNLVGIVDSKEFSFNKGYGGTNKISFEKVVSEDKNTFKAFVWNSYTEIRPLKDMLTISPNNN